jgi:hypothetical protein
MAALLITGSLMGRETDYHERTIDDHIDDLEDLGVI